MVQLSARHPRYGYRRIWALLRREHWRVNRKRVQRLWRQEGLRVPQRQRKRRRMGNNHEQLYAPAGDAQEPCLELRLRDGPDGGLPPPEAAAGRGRVYA